MNQTAIHFTSRQDVSNEDMVTVARQADALGYHSFWTGESWGRDVFTMLALLASQTQSIRLATGIVPVFSRSAALIAQSIASLDLISNGRAILGLGTSGRAVIENWHGVPFTQPLQRTREYLQIIRQALRGERVNHQGQLIQVQNFRMATAPLQEHLPIFLASLGPRNLKLTGELADGWLPIWVPQHRLPELKGTVVRAAEQAGRDPGAVTIAPQIICMPGDTPEDLDRAQALVRAHMAYYIGGMGTYYYNLFSRLGYQSESDSVRGAWLEGHRDRAAAAITEEMLDSIAILGDASSCRQQLQRFRDQGADLPVLAFPHGATLADILRTVAALAPVAESVTESSL